MSRLVSRAALALALAVGVVSLDSRAGAFADSGHRIVGRLAELHLAKSRAMTEVRGILRPGESLAEAAVWPDTIKDPLYEDEDTGRFRLDHPGHDTYHYANLPYQADRYSPDALGARPTDIVQIARESIRVLQGASTAFRKREALRLLAHLTGDIHQALHVGNAFVSVAAPPRFVVPEGANWRSSLGGNALVYGPQQRFNLHSYWDAHAVNLSMRSDDVPAYAARLLREVPVRGDWTNSGRAEDWPAQWATEALQLAKEAHRGIRITRYLGPDDARRTAHRWLIEQPAGYDDQAKRVTPLQLAKAGHRLAATLQAIWPK